VLVTRLACGMFNGRDRSGDGTLVEY